MVRGREVEYILLYTYIIDYIVIARACAFVHWYKRRKQNYTSEVCGSGAVGERWQRGGRGGSGGGGNSNSKGASSTTAAAAVLFTSNAP